jgi:hypothetical protein
LERVRDVLVLRLPFMVDCKVSHQVKNQVRDKARNTLENQINDNDVFDQNQEPVFYNE